MVNLNTVNELITGTTISLNVGIVNCSPFLSPTTTRALGGSIRVVGSLSRVFPGTSCIAIRIPLAPRAGRVVYTRGVTGVGSAIEVVGLTENSLTGSTSIISTLRSNEVTTCMASFPSTSLVKISNIVTVPRLNTSAPRDRRGYTAVNTTRLVSFLRGNGVVGSIGVPTISDPGYNTTEVAIVRGGRPGVVTAVDSAVDGSKVGVTGFMGGGHNRVTCDVLSISSSIPNIILNSVRGVTNIMEIHIVGWCGAVLCAHVYNFGVLFEQGYFTFPLYFF